MFGAGARSSERTEGWTSLRCITMIRNNTRRRAVSGSPRLYLELYWYTSRITRCTKMNRKVSEGIGIDKSSYQRLTRASARVTVLFRTHLRDGLMTWRKWSVTRSHRITLLSSFAACLRFSKQFEHEREQFEPTCYMTISGVRVRCRMMIHIVRFSRLFP